MKTRVEFKTITTVIVLMSTLLLAACGGGGSASTTGTQSALPTTSAEPEKTEMQKATVQLKWVPQAQFAGIYVAAEKGFYKDEGIDIKIVPGGPDVVAEQQVANGVADVGITGVESLLVNRENGVPLVSLAQITQKSSKVLIAKKSTGIDSPEKMKGKKIATFMGGKQFQAIAYLEHHGIDPEKDIQLVKQGFTMDQFFNDQVDVATATIYNEYHVVLESGMKESDLYVFNIEDAAISMLEDTLFAREDWVENNRDLAVKIVRATLKGWNYAIENQEEAIDIVMKNVIEGSTTRQHQVTMLQEMAKLIKPEGFTSDQVGMFVDESFKRTADIMLKYGLIKKPADLESAFDESIYEDAVAK